jgi:hypothetical protein
MCFVEMHRRVFAGRRVATAHVTALHAFPQRNPGRTFFQTFLASDGLAKRLKVSLRNVLKMLTWLVHTFSPLVSVRIVPIAPMVQFVERLPMPA